MSKGEFKTTRLVKRLNRFVALIEVENKEELAHIPNSGRMGELLYPGAQVIVKRADNKERKTGYDLLFAFDNGNMVAIDSRLPNDLLAEGLQGGMLPELGGYRHVKREPGWGNSRFDLLLQEDGREDCLVEIKSVNLVKEGTALFPDAPTLRGRRHLDELARAAGEGIRPAVFFLVMREDSYRVCPNDSLDPLFGKALRSAKEKGVEVLARGCRLKGYRVEIDKPLPVIL